MTYFDEQFDDTSLEAGISPFALNTTAAFQITTGGHFSGLVGTRSAGTNEDGSIVGLWTDDTDYNLTDWTAKVVVWRTLGDYGGNGTGELFLFGFGNNANGDWFGDILSNAIIGREHVSWNPGNWGGDLLLQALGRTGAGTASGETLDTGWISYPGGANQEFAFTMTKTGTSLLYEIDINNDSSVEYSKSFDLTLPAYDWYNDNNARVFIGWRRDGGTELASFTMSGTNVPEPSSLALAGLGLVGLAGWGWRRRASKWFRISVCS